MDYFRSDCILREILENRKSLAGFLDAVFGFMSRNTDFYHIQKTKDDKIGFPRGIKEQILMSCMQKYEHVEFEKDLAIAVPSCIAEEVEIITDESHEGLNKGGQCSNQNVAETNALCSINSAKFNVSDYKNGSVFDNYCWSQTIKDVEVNIILPKTVKMAKNIKVNFQPKYMTVKTLLPKEEYLLNGETWDKYRHNNVIWSISDGKLIISFDKRKQCWWDKLFLYENAIDNKTVDTELSSSNNSIDIQNNVDRYKQESSSNHASKTMPLNKSEQIARLREAWNAENSPFKGKSFDPSIIQFT